MSYLKFDEFIPDKPRKTQIFKVRNKRLNEDIGTIEWDCGFRKYVYLDPPHRMRFCEMCLFELGNFVKKLNEEYKNGK